MKAFEKNIRKVEPYVPGEQPQRKVIKLNTNENPYAPAPGVTKALEEMNTDRLRLYPDPTAAPLVNALADFYHVNPDQVFVGVGSDDVLSMCFLTFFNSEKPILFPDITYSFYDVWADLFRIPYERPALDEEFHIRKEDYFRENGGIVFPNPNAPTGVEEPQAMIEEILQANPDVVVIVDEAYVDFGGTSALPLLKKYENLLVVQTFSKSRAMAGMRIGFCIGNEKLIHYLNDVKFSFNSYTMNLPSQVMGVEAVKDDAYFKATTAKIAATRERIKKELTSLGFTFPDSKANFIFASHKEVPAEELFRALREADIYVRHWNKPRIANSLRISVGTDEEMDRLIAFLKEYLEMMADDYDFIIIDCPPSLNMLTINSMTTADSVLVPIQCEYYALEGLSQLIHTINLVKERLNPNLNIDGVVFTMYDSRTNLSMQVVENVKQNLNQKVYNTLIPRNIRLAEAPSYGMPINMYDPKSAGAEAYMQLAEEVIKNK